MVVWNVSHPLVPTPQRRSAGKRDVWMPSIIMLSGDATDFCENGKWVMIGTEWKGIVLDGCWYRLLFLIGFAVSMLVSIQNWVMAADGSPFEELFKASLKCILPTFGIRVVRATKEGSVYLVSSKDVFVNLPTGFGKSLIYQLALLVDEKMSRHEWKNQTAIVLVISPLAPLRLRTSAQGRKMPTFRK